MENAENYKAIGHKDDHCSRYQKTAQKCLPLLKLLLERLHEIPERATSTDTNPSRKLFIPLELKNA
jgi:hypothetical protein